MNWDKFLGCTYAYSELWLNKAFSVAQLWFSQCTEPWLAEEMHLSSALANHSRFSALWCCSALWDTWWEKHPVDPPTNSGIVWMDNLALLGTKQFVHLYCIMIQDSFRQESFQIFLDKAACTWRETSVICCNTATNNTCFKDLTITVFIEFSFVWRTNGPHSYLSSCVRAMHAILNSAKMM